MTSLDGLRAGTTGEENTLAEKRERMGLRPGQLDPQTSEIGHRMRELAGRKAYLRNFWYAAGGVLPSCTCLNSALSRLTCRTAKVATSACSLGCPSAHPCQQQLSITR